METADIMFGYDELTKPSTCGCESVRSTVRALPFLVTVARMWMSVKPWPSSSRIASPRYTPSFHVAMHARVWRSALSRISSTAGHDGLGAVLVEQREHPPLAHAGGADHGAQVAQEVVRVAHVGRDHLHHVVAHLARVVELQRRDAEPFLPDLRRAGVVGAVGRAADVALVRAVDRPEHQLAARRTRARTR